MQNYPAPFITLEGVDGAGKSSHMETIISAIERAGFEVVSTREPGGTEIGSVLRAQLKKVDMDPRTAAMIAFADRNEHLEQKIRPALSSGKVVLSDRFTDSTYAYQGGGEGCDWDYIAALENMVHADCKPNLTLFFDLPGKVAEARRGRRKEELQSGDTDRFDEKSVDYFETVRNAYLRRVEESPERFKVIDASGSLEHVAEQVKEAVEGFMQKWVPPAPRSRSVRP